MYLRIKLVFFARNSEHEELKTTYLNRYISMAALVVSPQSLQVLASDQGIFTMLGYHPYKINGNNIFAITGVQSDTCMLQSAIESMQGLKVQLILYDASGRARRLIVSCSPHYENLLNFGCLLTIQPSEAVTLQDAFADCPHARALVSADYPHAVHMANGAFLDRFSCGRKEVLGQPLHFFSSMDSTSFARAFTNPCSAESEEAWSSLLAIALNGQLARWRRDASNDVGIQICVNDADEVTCTPVVEAPNGYIRHIVVSFGPPPGVGSADARSVDGCGPPDPGQSAKRRVRPGLEKTAEAANGIKTSFLVCPRLRSLGPAIFPRRKPSLQVQRARNDIALAPPVVVTRELISALAELPLNKAAAAAGVSATAFKKACRKLGVRRWAYKRGRSALSVSAALSGPYAPDGIDAGLQGCCASADSESGPGSPATPASANFCSATADDQPETNGWSSARQDLCLCDDVSYIDAAKEPHDATLFTCSAAAFTPAQSCPARSPICMVPTSANGLQADGGRWSASGAAPASEGWLRAEGCDWSASEAAAAIGQVLEEPVLDEALVREMLDMPWPLQA